MGERRDLWFIMDALLVFVPFSIIGAIFGDTIRKDVLTRRQRGVAALFCLVLGPVCGRVVMSEWGWSDWTGLAVAAIVPTLAYDIVGLWAAVIRQAKEDPRGWFVLAKDALVAALAALLPWRK
jgi:hypothetical protein